MLKRIKNIFHTRAKKQSLTASQEIDNLFETLNEDLFTITMGSDLSPLSELAAEKISEIRREIKDECGFILPPVRLLENNCLQENEFNIYIRGKFAEKGYLIPNRMGIAEEFYEITKTSVYNNINELFTNEITEKYVEQVQRKNNWLIWNLSYKISMSDIKTIMLEIIKKGKSINNVNYIFELIGEMVLSDSKWNDYCSTKYSPENIAKKIVKRL